MQALPLVLHRPFATRCGIRLAKIFFRDKTGRRFQNSKGKTMLTRTLQEVLDSDIYPVLDRFATNPEKSKTVLRLSVIFFTQAVGPRTIGSITELDHEDFIGWLYENAEYDGEPLCARRVHEHVMNVKKIESLALFKVGLDA